MEKFGYIVTDRKLNDVKEYVELVDDIKLADSTKPILIVGLNKAKEYAGDNFSILEKQLSENVFWTFRRTEKRQDFEKDIILFYKFITRNIINNINYYYINLYNIKYNRIKKLYNILFRSINKKYIFIKNNMIYFNYENNNVFGISLAQTSYIGISKKKLYLKLKNSSNTVINFDSSPIPNMFKGDLGDKNYAIPYIMRLIGE